MENGRQDFIPLALASAWLKQRKSPAPASAVPRKKNLGIVDRSGPKTQTGFTPVNHPPRDPKTSASYKSESFLATPLRKTERPTLRSMQPVEPGIYPDDLVPLPIATKIIEAELYAHDLGSRLGRRTGIAHAIAALVPLYVYSLNAAEIYRLTDRELLPGVFREDGAELRFRDGRPTIKNIAVAENRIAEVTTLLKSAGWRAKG